ncbi:MAG: site-2 protease family protein [Anaerolineales bacterium]|nr:site-2 protease family protein [Anaerolineales bacterium]
MKWSWKLGTFAGIDVFIHATFLLIIGFVGFSYWQQTGTLAGTLEGILFTLLLFGFVVLHEYGHALTARRYGIKTRDITLYPIGGVARLERMPDKPIQELWVALAGPAVNVVIAVILFAWLIFSNTLEPLTRLSITGGPLIERLMLVNIWLVLFNLIPAFPMDGGRVLRALLALRLEYTRATQIAAAIGQGMALIFGLVGLFTNPFLLFIAFFVWIGAGQEASMVQMKSALGGIPVRRVLITDFQSLSPQDTLGRAVELILSGSQTDFPVVENNQVLGVLARNDILAALSRQDRSAPVVSIMRRDFQVVDANEMLEPAFTRLQTCGCHTMPVTYNGQLVGLLTADNIGEFLMIQSVMRQTPQQRQSFAQ